ncbi:hypothetical protein, partial [Plasmodium yoelii yoelii]
YPFFGCIFRLYCVIKHM